MLRCAQVFALKVSRLNFKLEVKFFLYLVLEAKLVLMTPYKIVFLRSKA